jgi:hypothetical protein
VTPAPSLVGLFVAPLNRAGIEYMVTGGLAAIIHGHPRLTREDIHTVVVRNYFEILERSAR